jgi:hypothetical protein
MAYKPARKADKRADDAKEDTKFPKPELYLMIFGGS